MENLRTSKRHSGIIWPLSAWVWICDYLSLWSLEDPINTLELTVKQHYLIWILKYFYTICISLNSWLFEFEVIHVFLVFFQLGPTQLIGRPMKTVSELIPLNYLNLFFSDFFYLPGPSSSNIILFIVSSLTAYKVQFMFFFVVFQLWPTQLIGRPMKTFFRFFLMFLGLVPEALLFNLFFQVWQHWMYNSFMFFVVFQLWPTQLIGRPMKTLIPLNLFFSKKNLLFPSLVPETLLFYLFFYLFLFFVVFQPWPTQLIGRPMKTVSELMPLIYLNLLLSHFLK